MKKGFFILYLMLLVPLFFLSIVDYVVCLLEDVISWDRKSC